MIGGICVVIMGFISERQDTRPNPNKALNSESESRAIIRIDGLIVKDKGSRFTRSPVKFLQDFLTKIRQDCDSIEKTRMSRSLSGNLLGRIELDP